MTDFVEYAPGRVGAAGAGPTTAIVVRAATEADVGDLARVRAVRGGTVEEHLDAARSSIERLPVLRVAEADGALVGWSGAQRFAILPDAEPEWLVAGLTVVPERRRQGIALRLLTEVLSAVRDLEPGVAVFSVINARNLASIDLHERLGFHEVERAPQLAGVTFTGGEGVLVRQDPAVGPR